MSWFGCPGKAAIIGVRTDMKTWKGDVCIIGAGATGVAVASKLANMRSRNLRIAVVDAGSVYPFEDRFRTRERMFKYGEDPWAGSQPQDLAIQGDWWFNTMAVGGMATQWNGRAMRFTAEDFRSKSMLGLGADWPLSYADLEPFYCEAERLIGVAGTPSPHDDFRSERFPMPPFPLQYNLQKIHAVALAAGIETQISPYARNTEPYDGRSICMRCDTCSICPTGAKYTPDMTLLPLVENGKIDLAPHTVAYRFELDKRTSRVLRCLTWDRKEKDKRVFEADIFVVAAGYAWSPFLLLASTTTKFQRGIGNSSGLVGRYIAGHVSYEAIFELPYRLYPGIHANIALCSKQFMRVRPGKPPVRFDLSLTCQGDNPDEKPRLFDESGRVLFGDKMLADWRHRTRNGRFKLRSYVEVTPSIDSRVELDNTRHMEFGAPLPKIQSRVHADAVALRPQMLEALSAVVKDLETAGARLLAAPKFDFVVGGARLNLAHPSGGCRMALAPSDGVCESTGRTFDHENLYVVGAPTCVSGGCTNATLTFIALALRSAEQIGRDLV